MKWKNSGQKRSIGILDQKKPTGLKPYIGLKPAENRLSYKGYFNRRVSTDPEESFDHLRGSNLLQNRHSFGNFFQKDKCLEKTEGAENLMTKRTQQNFKSQKPHAYVAYNWNSEMSSHQNRSSNIEYTLHEQETQSKIRNSGALNLGNEEYKWKKYRLKKDQTYNKLK